MEIFVTNVDESAEEETRGMDEGDRVRVTRTDGAVFDGEICSANSVGVAVVFDDESDETVSNETPLEMPKMDFSKPDHHDQKKGKSGEQEPLEPTVIDWSKK
jgi:hypothetical protein